MIRFLKMVYRIVGHIIVQIKMLLRLFFYFILPNLSFLISGRLKKSRFPICNQKTFLTGSGSIEIGNNCSLGYRPGGFHRGGSIEFQTRHKNAYIKIGNNVATNNNLFFSAANCIEIGDDTLIGQYVTVMDYEAHGTSPEMRRQMGEIGRVIIGKNVWIGNNVVILKNSELGDNTIIAAGAVVSGKFPANMIIGGVPAKIIKPL